MKRYGKLTWKIIAANLSIILLFGCVSRKNIKVPLSDPMPHPMLAQMQSMSIEEKDGVIYFGESKKYKKREITVVSLKGEPYEIGYAHGVLLKDDMIPKIREIIYWAKTHTNILFIYQPSKGYAFASVSGPEGIGVGTAMNETGLNLGSHSIYKSSENWKGIPYGILQREIIDNAHSVEEVGKILKKAPRPGPLMLMVTDTKKARIYEYDSEKIGYKDMEEERLIVTNYTQELNIYTIILGRLRRFD